MQLVHVIPIVRGIAKEQLTYFTRKGIRPGMLVRVPLRNKQVLGVVASAEQVLDVKTKIKQYDFPVKKIESLYVDPFFTPSFMGAAEESSLYFATTIGAVLHRLVPRSILTDIDTLDTPHNTSTTRETATLHDTKVLEGNYPTRLLQYKNIIRESFARKKSVYLCASTIAEVERLGTDLEKGIEPYVYVLHSTLSQKEIRARFQKASMDTHPIVIVATGSFFSLPRTDLGTIILERESSRFFKLQSRPFIDIRIFAEIYAKKLGAQLVLSDMPLRVETYWKAQEQASSLLSELRSREESKTEHVILDMRPEKNSQKRNSSFTPLSPQVEELLVRAHERKERVLVFNARRGIAPTTLCEECGSVVLCTNCSAPAVLHKGKKENVFVCHKCGDLRSAKERCYTCRGWKLKPLGVGSERVKSAIADIKKEGLFAIDADTTTTHRQARNVAKAFYDTAPAVLVGTEMVLPYLEKQIDHVVVTSIDALLSLPDPFVSERVFGMLLTLRRLSRTSFVLQTRQPDLPMLSYVCEGSLKKFYNMEIQDRKQFNYPPYTILIKISVSGVRPKVIKDMEQLEKTFSEYTFHIYPAFTKVAKGKFSLHALIRVARDAWPDKKLLALLIALPVYMRVDVAPQSTL